MVNARSWLCGSRRAISTGPREPRQSVAVNCELLIYSVRPYLAVWFSGGRDAKWQHRLFPPYRGTRAYRPMLGDARGLMRAGAALDLDCDVAEAGKPGEGAL